ncbi:hypothetical protein V5740_13970 (plasmid) [Croceibacterium sp. TMG7-5b_MA50]|uniref:hypothetical protein n=1 Tax=Croceibacterium sp. TMG7-5b_MA50 TaxID=3121290 RepID=UPI0032221476
MTDPAAILRRETLVSAAINAAISVGFFLLVFGLSGPVPVRGVGAYAFDFAPQSLAIGIMATLVPALLLRAALRRGGVSGVATRGPTTRAIVLRALAQGIAAMVIGGGLCAALLWVAGVQQLPLLPAFAAKVAYGAALGAFITRRTLARMLARPV